MRYGHCCHSLLLTLTLVTLSHFYTHPQGNWNNVLEVAPPPRIETPEEQAHYAALQAVWSAFEHKMHFKRAGHMSMHH